MYNLEWIFDVFYLLHIQDAKEVSFQVTTGFHYMSDRYHMFSFSLWPTSEQIIGVQAFLANAVDASMFDFETQGHASTKEGH
jgi:hypothetical protein